MLNCRAWRMFFLKVKKSSIPSPPARSFFFSPLSSHCHFCGPCYRPRHVSWKYSRVKERPVSSCPWEGSGDECGMIAKLNDNYSIHYFGSGTGGRQRGSWELGGSWRSHSFAVRACKSSAFMYIYRRIQVCAAPLAADAPTSFDIAKNMKQ